MTLLRFGRWGKCVSVMRAFLFCQRYGTAGIAVAAARLPGDAEFLSGEECCCQASSVSKTLPAGSHGEWGAYVRVQRVLTPTAAVTLIPKR